jgi:1-acyl-sn-glycerol-3-phosphate acyltransferase
MWRIRSLLFNILFYGGSAIFLTLCLPILFLPRKIQRYIPSIWVKSVYWLERFVLGLDYQVIGIENLPPAPYLVAMKHQSAWETMKLYHLFGDPAIVLKKELMDLPLWGRYARIVNMVPVDRSKGREAMYHMVESAKSILIDKRPLVVFPQGTRIAVGKKAPYKFGIMKLYEGLGVPLVPVALNAGLFWPRNSFWKKPGKITVEILPPIAPHQDVDKVFTELQQILEERSDQLAKLG